jgi:hypothetical protein
MHFTILTMGIVLSAEWHAARDSLTVRMHCGSRQEKVVLLLHTGYLFPCISPNLPDFINFLGFLDFTVLKSRNPRKFSVISGNKSPNFMDYMY